MDIVKDRIISFLKQTKILAKKIRWWNQKKQLVDKTIRQIKPGVNKDIRKIIEFEEDDGKPVRIGNFGITIISNMRVMVIKIKKTSYFLNNSKRRNMAFNCSKKLSAILKIW